jgi:CHAT domain-containing protein
MLVTEQTTLQERIKTTYPDYYALKYPQPASFAELQQDFLQPGELLLVYNVMEERTILWLLSSDRMQIYTLPVGEEELQKKITEFREVMESEWKNSQKNQKTKGKRGLTLSDWQKPEDQTERGTLIDLSDGKRDKRSTFLQASHSLHASLIPDDVRSLLTENYTVNIVPTGPLYALPFEALVTSPPAPLLQGGEGRRLPLPLGEGRGEGKIHYLIEDIPVSYLSSASLLKTLREAHSRRKTTAPYPLLAFAHPVYKSKTPQEDDPIRALRRQSYREFCGDDFAELPETADEARAIANLFNVPEKSDHLQLRENAS